MISRRIRLMAGVLAMTACLVVFAACTGKVATNLPEPDYASAITESLLLAINSADYAGFSKDFDSTMLKALPVDNFKAQFTEGIQGKIGDYQAGSKRFFQASSQAQFTTIAYYAQYSGDPGAVLITISFKTVEGKPKVSGLFFNSPKLRG